MSTSSCSASRVIHVVPGPWAATTMSTVPPYVPDGLTLWIEKQRRSRFAEVSPPTASATNWPGRASSAMPGATNVRCWYAPDAPGRDELAGDLDDPRHRLPSA